jgi:hypothetical protein
MYCPKELSNFFHMHSGQSALQFERYSLNETKLSEVKMNAAKEKIRELLEKLPEDCTVEDVQRGRLG